jgi:UDP-N-acetylglucosamine 2-epimerase (non-hydrolysing)
VVSDSGTLAEESAILGFPAVSARTSTERQEAAERGGFVVGGIGLRSLSQAVQLAVASNEGPVSVPDYDEAECSKRVVHIIQSYTGVINRMVWRKPDA